MFERITLAHNVRPFSAAKNVKTNVTFALYVINKKSQVPSRLGNFRKTLKIRLKFARAKLLLFFSLIRKKCAARAKIIFC